MVRPSSWRIKYRNYVYAELSRITETLFIMTGLRFTYEVGGMTPLDDSVELESRYWIMLVSGIMVSRCIVVSVDILSTLFTL